MQLAAGDDLELAAIYDAMLDRAAATLAAADRIRYLTPRLHAEMFAELRSPGDPLRSRVSMSAASNSIPRIW